jgi:hypothetical protein
MTLEWITSPGFAPSRSTCVMCMCARGSDTAIESASYSAQARNSIDETQILGLHLGNPLNPHQLATAAHGNAATNRQCERSRCAAIPNETAATTKVTHSPIPPQNKLLSCHALLGGVGDVNTRILLDFLWGIPVRIHPSAPYVLGRPIGPDGSVQSLRRRPAPDRGSSPWSRG